VKDFGTSQPPNIKILYRALSADNSNASTLSTPSGGCKFVRLKRENIPIRPKYSCGLAVIVLE
jgi:hypothetical protein